MENMRLVSFRIFFRFHVYCGKETGKRKHMVTNRSVPDNWQILLNSSLRSEKTDDKLVALDFLSQQSSLSLEFARQLMPMINEAIVHPDTQVRYFARRARNHFYDCYPEIESEVDVEKPFKLDITDGQPLSTQEILLHKMRLGSRYVVFEAMERLTESGDPSLTTPLLNYLKNEKDEYKVSYLIRILNRIDDPRIPDALEDYLDHEDPRIIANALEALCDYERPELAEKLTDFATSSDNRIRANAVKGLHRYSPALAEGHISEMVKSHNIALQDSGVYLLREIRPSNLGELLEFAQHSRYASVRLKTLDIQPPTSDEHELAELRKKEDIEQPDPRRDLFLMGFFLATGVLLLLFGDLRMKRMLSIFFLGIAVITLLTHEKTRTSIQKTSLSMGFIASLAWGNTRLMVLPALMGLWLTWNSNKLNQHGKFEKAPPANIFAWFFAIGAIIITQLIQDDLSLILGLGAQITAALNKAPQFIVDIVSRHSRFEMMNFAIVSTMTIFLMKFGQWFPPKTPGQSPQRRLVVATVVCLGILLLMNLFHVWGIKLQIRVNGCENALAMLKKLIP